MTDPIRPRRPVIDKPSLLVLNEKHGDRYFHVEDDAALFRAALTVVLQRYKEGYWYANPMDCDQPKNPGMTMEQAKTLPDGPIRVAAVAAVNQYRQACREVDDLTDTWNIIQKAVNDRDGRLAWQVLRDYSDGEYQRVSIEPYSKIEVP